MKYFLLALALFASNAQAEAPWVRDCVKWYGGMIPVEERTEENCPNLRSHWDTDREFLAMEDKYRAKKDWGMIGLIDLIKASKQNFPEYFNDGRIIAGAGTGGGSAGVRGTQVITPQGGYQIIQSGSSITVIQTSKSK